MSPEDVGHQAEAFLAYESRSGLGRGEAFERWAASKDFDPDDAREISRAVQRRSTGIVEDLPREGSERGPACLS